MTDDHVEELLDRYRTGDLAAIERDRVGAHLERCAECRAAGAELEAFAAAVSRGYAAAREAAPAPDWARQREAILARTSARPSRRRSWLGGWVPQAAAAALAVIAVGVLWRAEIRGPAEADRAVAPTASTGVELETRADGPTDTRASSRIAPAPAGDAAVETVAPSISRDGAERERLEAGRLQNERLDRPSAPEGFADREADFGVADERANAAGADAGEEEEAEGQRRAQEPAAPAAQEAPAELRAEQKAAAENRVSEPAAARAVDRARALDDASRFETQARGALADRDTFAAGRTYALWRDTLAAGDALTPERQAALQALADSLAALLAARP